MSSVSDFVIENGVLKKYVGHGGDVVVPEGVTEIAANAFNVTAWGNIDSGSNLRSIQLPSTLRIIGPNAFCWCSLGRLDIPDGVIKIGHKAFNFCSLSEISIPASVCDIGSEALKDTPWLRVHANDPIVYAGRVLLLCNSREGELKVRPDTVGIAGEAFSSCKGLKKVIIPETIKVIGNRAFAKCEELEQVSILGHPIIGKDCFPAETAVFINGLPIEQLKGAKLKQQAARGLILHEGSLSEKIENSLIKYIEKNFDMILPELKDNLPLLQHALEKALLTSAHTDRMLDICSDNAAITAALLEYKHNLDDVGRGAQPAQIDVRPATAAELKKLWKTASLPDGSLELVDYKGAEETVFVPDVIGKKTVARIGEKSLAAGGGLFSAQSVLSGKAHGINQARLQIRSVIIARGIRSIGAYAFCDCVNLFSVELSEMLETIDEYAFRNCCGFTHLALPASLRNIKEGAFSNCNGLQQLMLPEGVQRLGDYVFWNCSGLKRIVLPVSIDNIGTQCFEGCSKLTIHAPAGSYAEQYAKEHGIPFAAE